MKFVSASKLLFALFLVASDGESGVRRPRGRELSPEHAGALHTEVLTHLADKYRMEKPKTFSHYLKDVGDVVAAFCGLVGNQKCVSNAYKQTVNQFARISKSEGGTSHFSNAHENLDSAVRSALDRTYDLVNEFGTTREKDLDYFVAKMKTIREELKNMTNVDDAHRFIGVGAVSVGMESAKYWHEAYYDETNPFHKAVRIKLHGDRRRLDDIPTFGEFHSVQWKKVVRADMDGGIMASIDSIASAPSIIFDRGQLTFSILLGAVPASAAVLFDSREPCAVNTIANGTCADSNSWQPWGHYFYHGFYSYDDKWY